MHSALEVFEQIPAPRRIVFLGAVSEPPGAQRPIYQALGERVAGMATHLVVFHRDFEPIWSGARRGGMPRSSVTETGRTVHDAAEALSQILHPGDVLLIKGRGPEKLDRVRLILEGAPGRMRYSLLQLSHAGMRRLCDAGARLGAPSCDHVGGG